MKDELIGIFWMTVTGSILGFLLGYGALYTGV